MNLEVIALQRGRTTKDHRNFTWTMCGQLLFYNIKAMLATVITSTSLFIK